MSKALTLSRPLEGLRTHAARMGLHAERLWRAYPRETVGVGMFGVVVAAAIGGAVF